MSSVVAATAAQNRCSGVLSGHDGVEPREVKVLVPGGVKTVTLCQGCHDTAARMGMVDRRSEPR